MKSLSAMSSTEFNKLIEKLGDEAQIKNFVNAVARLIDSHPHDGGADSDHVYMIGRRLHALHVFDIVPAKILAAGLIHSDVEQVKNFLACNEKYLEKVLSHRKKSAVEVKPVVASTFYGGGQVTSQKTRMLEPVKLAGAYISDWKRSDEIVWETISDVISGKSQEIERHSRYAAGAHVPKDTRRYGTIILHVPENFMLHGNKKLLVTGPMDFDKPSQPNPSKRGRLLPAGKGR